MEGYRFEEESGKFRWVGSDLIVEFSEPSIQGHSDYIQIQSEKSIKYYYYKVSIFKKIIEWSDDDDNDERTKKFELVSERHTHDFPAITELRWILEHQLKDDSRIDGQKIEYESGNVRYRKTFETEGFACDDFYEVTKIVESSGDEVGYIVFCGTSFDAQGDLNSIGVRTPYVKRNDIEEFLKCVNSFIQYSIEDHNKHVRDCSGAFKIKDKKVYEYFVDDSGVNTDVIESIYVVSDNIEIITVVDNKQKSHRYSFVKDIDDSHIYLSDGKVIDIGTVAYIHNTPTDEMLCYNEEQITAEFISILSQDEKEEFITGDIDTLNYKYNSAIQDRTWMCRKEHNFDIDYESEHRHEAINSVIFNVVVKIKDNLENQTV